MSLENVNELRAQMKEITNQIMSLIDQRMQLAKRIGGIKDVLNLEIVDEKAEHELKSHILNCSKNLQLDPEFSGRIVNLLISEAVKIQKYQRNSISEKSAEPLSPHKDNGIKSLKKNIDENLHNGKLNLPLKIRTHMDVFNAAKYLESQGQKIIHMEVGEPDFLPPIEVKAALEAVYDKQMIHYTQAEGLTILRDALSKHISNFFTSERRETAMSIESSNIIITPGSRFGIFAAFSSILRPGDEIVVIEPAWPACVDCANYLGVRTRFVRTNLSQNWEPNISELESLVNNNTKIISINYPNNPTGKILPRKLLEEIVNLAVKKNLFLLSDEVYSNYNFKEFHSVIDFEYEKSILLNSFSKTFAMTGFRVGYLHTLDKSLIQKLKKFQALTLTSVAEPMQFCALKALESESNENCDSVKNRVDLVCNSLRKLPFHYVTPDGAMYIFAKLDSDLKKNDLEVVEHLLTNGVAVAPGSAFGSNYFDYIRISTCIDEAKIKQGMDIITKTINQM